MTDINQGKICPYCLSPTQYIDSSSIYGKSYGMVYICKPCNAWVGVHKGTNIALGRLADSELREAKKKAHYFFDQIAKTNLINKVWDEYIPYTGNRNKAYLWLSKQMGIEPKLCHIGMFNIVQCEVAIDLVKKALRKIDDKTVLQSKDYHK